MTRKCVICQQEFDENTVSHMPDRPPAERWTCGVLCQKRLTKRIEQNQAPRLVRDEAPEADDDAPSEAEKARAVLRPPPVRSTPSAPHPGGMEFARAARHLIAAADEVSEPEDRGVLLSLADGFLGRALEAFPVEGDEEADPSPELVARVASVSRPGTTHEVTRTGGKLSCSCPSFAHRGTCKHVRR